jgi:hypothetical protein
LAVALRKSRPGPEQEQAIQALCDGVDAAELLPGELTFTLRFSRFKNIQQHAFHPLPKIPD